MSNIKAPTSITKDQLDNFYGALIQNFSKAYNSNATSLDRYFNIAGRKLKLSFACSSLVDVFTQAFEHLAISAANKPDFTIYIWDSLTTKTELPNVPWLKNGKLAKEDVTDDLYNWIKINNSDPEVFVRAKIPLLMVINKKENCAYCWTPSACDVPWHIGGLPCLYILNRWLTSGSVVPVHSGGVGNDNGAVIFAGKGGAGKSTTVLACLQSSLKYIGEDYCLLTNDPVPTAFSLFNSAKLSANSMRMFPQYAPWIVNQHRQPDEKALFFYNQIHPEKMLYRAPIKAIIGLQITNNEKTTLSSISRGSLLRELAITTIYQEGNNPSNMLEIMAKIIGQVPCYQLNLGYNILDISRNVVNLLETKA